MPRSIISRVNETSLPRTAQVNLPTSLSVEWRIMVWCVPKALNHKPQAMMVPNNQTIEKSPNRLCCWTISWRNDNAKSDAANDTMRSMHRINFALK